MSDAQISPMSSTAAPAAETIPSTASHRSRRRRSVRADARPTTPATATVVAVPMRLLRTVCDPSSWTIAQDPRRAATMTAIAITAWRKDRMGAL
jgi:hypothetical protein